MHSARQLRLAFAERVQLFLSLLVSFTSPLSALLSDNWQCITTLFTNLSEGRIYLLSDIVSRSVKLGKVWLSYFFVSLSTIEGN